MGDTEKREKEEPVQALAVPANKPLSVFEAATYPACFTEFFYGDCAPFLKRAKPDFDPRTYGSAKFTGVVAGLSSIFEMTKQKGKGTTQMILYRPKIATP